MSGTVHRDIAKVTALLWNMKLRNNFFPVLLFWLVAQSCMTKARDKQGTQLRRKPEPLSEKDKTSAASHLLKINTQSFSHLFS